MAGEALVVVTGASSNHFVPLGNLLYSLARFEASTRVIVYDLGLSYDESRTLTHDGHQVRRFPFDQHPPHVDITRQRGQYAWKPIIVSDVLREVQGPVLWLDAGDLVHARLDGARGVLARQGVYSPRSAGDVARWTHPGTLAALGATPDLLSRPNRNGAVVGVSPAVAALVERWRECALDPGCIAPPGSSRANHRQDQAVLTVLAYQMQARYRYLLEDGLLGISTHNDRLSPAEVRRRLCWPT